MTPEQRAARERKQKIFVAVGSLVLVVLLAIQLPRVLGGSSSTAAEPATRSETASSTSGPPSAVPTAGQAAAAEAPLVSPAATSTKLRSFSLFAGTDPFVQKVALMGAASGGAASGSPPAERAAPEGRSGRSARKAATAAAVESRSEATPAKASFTQAAQATVIRVNGVPEALELGATFPANDPVLVLVAENPGKREVRIGIVGGTYANGARTVSLRVGKPLVLENTATGATYRLVLVAVGDGSGPSTERGAAASSGDR